MKTPKNRHAGSVSRVFQPCIVRDVCFPEIITSAMNIALPCSMKVAQTCVRCGVCRDGVVFIGSRVIEGLVVFGACRTGHTLDLQQRNLRCRGEITDRASLSSIHVHHSQLLTGRLYRGLYSSVL